MEGRGVEGRGVGGRGVEGRTLWPCHLLLTPARSAPTSTVLGVAFPLITNMYGNIYIYFNSNAKIDMHPVSVLPSWPWLALPASHATRPEGRREREAPPSSNSPGAALLGPGRDLG